MIYYTFYIQYLYTMNNLFILYIDVLFVLFIKILFYLFQMNVIFHYHMITSITIIIYFLLWTLLTSFFYVLLWWYFCKPIITFVSSLFCSGKPEASERRLFARLIMSVASPYFFPPYTFQIRVAGLYMLYGLFNSQLIAPKEKVCCHSTSNHSLPAFKRVAVCLKANPHCNWPLVFLFWMTWQGE